MKSLLLIAHGSRSPSANAEIAALTDALRDRGGYASVRHAYLEMAEPSIADAAEQLIADGATEIIALPYFLAAGRHVSDDVPAEIARVQGEHPQVNIRLTEHIGGATGMLALIESHLQR